MERNQHGPPLFKFFFFKSHLLLIIVSEKNFDKLFYLFIGFSILILIESFFYYYSYKLSYYFEYFDSKKSGYNPLIWKENGIIEVLQVILLFLSIFNFIYILKKIKKLEIIYLVKLTILIYTIGLIYFFFEEISWGQHIFGWESNSFFKSYNTQNETNIHNISNLFNQLPRSILLIWCSFSFIFIKIFSTKNSKFFFAKNFIMPSRNLKKISILLLLFFVPDFFIVNMGFHPGHGEYAKHIILSEILDFISFNFIKLSEYQELIFTYYIFCHSNFFKRFLSLNENEKGSKK